MSHCIPREQSSVSTCLNVSRFLPPHRHAWVVLAFLVGVDAILLPCFNAAAWRPPLQFHESLTCEPGKDYPKARMRMRQHVLHTKPRIGVTAICLVPSPSRPPPSTSKDYSCPMRVLERLEVLINKLAPQMSSCYSQKIPQYSIVPSVFYILLNYFWTSIATCATVCSRPWADTKAMRL